MAGSRAATVADLTVRLARRDEIALLAQFNAQLIRDERHENAMSIAELGERMREWLADDYRACLFETKAGPIGYALFRDLPECVHLRHFFVVPECRGIGLGQRAFHRLRAEFFAVDKRVLVEVLAWNASGLKFWKGLGFGERYLGLQLPAASEPSTP
jgi:GNAT superfamily N-acetyltransferase